MVNGKNKVKSEVKTLPILFSLLAAAFIGMFSEMSLNVALSSLMEELNITASTVQWLTTGYMLVISILVPISALLIQWFTTRQLFLTSMILFTFGTIIAAISPTFTILLIGRLIQAAGTGLLIPLMFNTVLTITPPQKRGSIMGIVGLTIMFAPAIGPTLSGLIIQNLHWHWLFWVLLPFLLIIIGIGYVNIQNISEISKPKIDLISIILSTIAFGGLVYGLSSAGEGEGGWSSPATIYSLIMGIIALILFILRQFMMKQPLVNLRAFKYPMFSLGVVLVMISMMVPFAFLILMPMYLQNSLGLTVFVSGLVLLPGGTVNGFMSPVTGYFFDKFGPKPLVIPGLLIGAVALWFFTDLTTSTTIITVIIIHCVLMFGMSMVMMPAQTNGLNQLPRELYPHGTAIMNTLQQLAGAMGTALCVTIMSAGQENYMKDLDHPLGANDIKEALTAGIQNGFMFGLILAIIGFVFAIFIRKSHHSQ
ncbi:MDR family MFS transporter [Niallia sp. FSL R7-0271]|uniref:MDR family MFS transporter n=1 Tax=Niallia sp. FSL R7-0271 TaxID=2921678 RepID=UPI0030F7691F